MRLLNTRSPFSKGGVLAKRGPFGVGADDVPPPGYVFLRGKNPDGSYSNLIGQAPDGSRFNLAGKIS